MVKNLIFMAVFALVLLGCGNSWEMDKKNIRSNLGSLKRNILVINAFNGDTLFRYEGKCYINDDSANNSVSLIYYVDGETKKADWLGSGFIFQAIEQ